MALFGMANTALGLSGASARMNFQNLYEVFAVLTYA